MIRKPARPASLFLLLGLQIAAAGEALPAQQSEEVQRLIAAAREKGENELNLSWSETTLGGVDGAKKFAALFNRMYGMNVKVSFTPGPNMVDMAGKISQEAAADQKATTDLLLGSEGIFAGLLNRKVMDEYDYSKLSSRIPKETVAPANIGVEILSLFPGITYNSNLVSAADAPKRLEDALHPKWKGKIASTPYATGFDRVAVRPEWGPEKMKAFLKKLSPNIGGLIRSGEQPRIASGEFLLMVMDAGGHQTRKYQAMGMPLGHLVPEDGATVGFLLFGVPRNSAHPNAAKLYIHMVMSEEGQKIVYETHFTDHHELPGSQSARALETLKAKGAKPLKIDVKFYAAHPELRKLSDELAKMLR